MPPSPTAPYINFRRRIVRRLAEYLQANSRPQAILNVSIERQPTTARVVFDTTWAASPTVEAYRLLTGDPSLDIVPPNRVAREVALFGPPRKRHALRLSFLPQETRYWYRITVPRRTPWEPDATGLVESRGEFWTLRRDVAVWVDRIHIIDDSDSDSAGDIRFATRCTTA
jgi:hypothetical protein